MRPHTVLASFLLMTALWITCSQGAPVIPNAGFEDHPEQPVSWVEYGDAVDGDPENLFRVYAAPRWGLPAAHGGSQAYGAVSFAPHYSGGLHGTVSGLTSGDFYEIGVYVYSHHADGGASGTRVGVDPAALGNPSSPSCGYTPFSKSLDTWSPISICFTATRDKATIVLSLSLHGDAGQEAFFDDVFISPAPDQSVDCVTKDIMQVFLTDFRIDRDSGEAVYSAPASYVITGLGFRAWFQDVTTVRVQMRRLNPDGTLGNPVEMRGGYEPDAGLEVNVDLPECHVLVGFGARAAYETDITTMAVWARPILADGSLGPLAEFRSGSLPDHTLEGQYIVDDGRVITGAGLRVSNGDVTGLYVESREFQARRTVPAEQPLWICH